MASKGIRLSPGVYKDPKTGKTYKSKDGSLPGVKKQTPSVTNPGVEAPTMQEPAPPTGQDVLDDGRKIVLASNDVLSGLFGKENFAKTWQDNGVANTKGLTDAVFGQLTARLGDRQKQGREQLQHDLVNKGIPVGSDAYNTAIREQERTYGDQYSEAENQAVQRGFDFWNQQAGTQNQTAQVLGGLNSQQQATDLGYANLGSQEKLGYAGLTSQQKIAKMNNDAALKAARIRSGGSGGSSGGGGGTTQPVLPSPFASGGLPNS